MQEAGWSEGGSTTIKSSDLVFGSSTKSTGNVVTVFYTQQGSYVIVEDVTKAIVQISDNINQSTLVPDLSIVDPYIPD